MKLPSKITSYSESVLSKLPIILDCLAKQDLSPTDLYDEVKDCFLNISEYIDALDCLFAMKSIDFDYDEEVIHYVM